MNSSYENNNFESLEQESYNYKELANKHILMTGATGGIGRVLLKELLKNKAKVCCFIHNEKKFPSEFQPYVTSGEVHTITVDLANPTTLVPAFKKAMMFLKGRLDTLFMCHGLFIYGGISVVTVEDFDRVYNLNVRSNFHILSLSVPFLKLTRGNVVMISSVETKIVEKDDFLHSLSKTMVNSMVQNSALELSEFGVRINAVAPGFVNTRHRESKYLSAENNARYLEQMGTYQLLTNDPNEPKDIVDAMIFLSSSESKFMTGEIMVVDSGYEINHDLSFKNSAVEDY